MCKYIGLMSGTSLDGIDAVLVEFSDNFPQVLAKHTEPLPKKLRHNLLLLCQTGNHEIDQLSHVEPQLSQCFASAVNHLLAKTNLDSSHIIAIGNHGQTIRHYPDHKYTLQIGDPNLLAELTQITVVCDFRRRDMAAGGQGAPLATAFHHTMFKSHSEDRVILNIGGISNITILAKSNTAHTISFDTGPGNLLLDYWCQKHKNFDYDIDGVWSASEKAHTPLLTKLISDHFFQLEPPKSTGREYFTHQWLASSLSYYPDLSPAIVQATLAALTATSITNAIKKYAPVIKSLFVCGGGAKNKHLISQIKSKLPGVTIQNTDQIGIHSDWVEAVAFAWLAHQTINKRPGNVSAATGATGERILGGIYYS